MRVEHEGEFFARLHAYHVVVAADLNLVRLLAGGLEATVGCASLVVVGGGCDERRPVHVDAFASQLEGQAVHARQTGFGVEELYHKVVAVG